MLGIKSNEFLEYLKTFKWKELVPIICPNCECKFTKIKINIVRPLLYKKIKSNYVFCSSQCFNLYNTKMNNIWKPCSNCGKEVKRQKNELLKIRNKSDRIFCDRSCRATYNNQHKTKGTTISKLEKYLQIQLEQFYPDLKIEFNSKAKLCSELDIFIPSLNLAFELNGIFHYEPVFGEERLKRIQENDDKKLKLCLEHNIKLITINTSSQKRFTEKSSQIFLDSIKNIIDVKIKK